MTSEHRIKVRLFAVARQLAGADHVEVSLPANASVGSLRAALAAACPSIAHVLPYALFSVNAEYAQDTQILPEVAEVACIPPVSGG